MIIQVDTAYAKRASTKYFASTKGVLSIDHTTPISAVA